MPNHSQQTLIGHAGSDVPAVRYTQNGKAVTDVNIAYTRKYGNQKQTIWTKVTFWGRTAEIAAQYVKKGNAVLVVGEPGEPDCWKDKNTGEPRARATLTAERLTLIGGVTEARESTEQREDSFSDFDMRPPEGFDELPSMSRGD